MKKENIPILRSLVHWLESANNAIEGIMHAAKTQKHLKFHFSVAFIILLFCFVIGVEKIDFTIISIVTTLVISAEMFNTAIENVVDLLHPERSESARIVKDVAAGAVLIVALGSVIVGYLILWPYFQEIFRNGFHIHRKHYAENITILSVIINLLLIILIKAYTGKGLPLQGGFPSGHSAVAFSLWVSLTYFTDHLLPIVISLAIALILSISRRFRSIHSWKEIIFGALIGGSAILNC